MTDFLFRVIFPMAFTGCAFALLLFGTYPLLRRLSAKLRRFVLLGVAVLFVMPLSLLFMQSGAQPQPLPRALQQAAPTAPVYQAGEVLYTAVQKSEPVGNAEPNTTAPVFTAPQIITDIYLAGVLGFGVICGVRYAFFNRRLRRSCSLIKPDETASKLLQPLCGELEIQRTPALVTSPLVSSPVLIGVLRPRIVLPTRHMTQSQCAFALRHELTHLKSGDIIVKIFLLAVNALHWWCPVLPALRRAFALACEDACDESVAQTLNGAQRKNYAETLLHFAAGSAPYATAGLALPAKNLKQRLQRLLHPQNPSRIVRLAGASAIALVLCVGLLAGCSFAAGAIHSSSGVPPESIPASGSLSYITSTEALQSGSNAPGSSAYLDDGSYTWPTPNNATLVREFSDAAHRGIDIEAEEGTPFNACGGGVVDVAEWHWSYGYYIIISHPDGIRTLYAHASALYVAQGQSVEKGQPIGATGFTGLSTGPHLHLEFLINDVQVDPLGYVAQPDIVSSEEYSSSSPYTTGAVPV